MLAGGQLASRSTWAVAGQVLRRVGAAARGAAAAACPTGGVPGGGGLDRSCTKGTATQGRGRSTASSRFGRVGVTAWRPPDWRRDGRRGWGLVAAGGGRPGGVKAEGGRKT